MNRRKFLQILIATPMVANMGLSAGVSDFKPTIANTKYYLEYDRYHCETHLRVDITLPDGKEWHSICTKTGGDFTSDPEVLKIMMDTHNAVLERKLGNTQAKIESAEALLKELKTL